MAAVFGATSTTDQVLEGVDLSGKRVLVTGVSAGLGVETARALASHGAAVVGAARDLTKAKKATEGIRAGAVNRDEFDLVELDLASLASVRGCADELVADDARNDAGADRPHQRGQQSCRRARLQPQDHSARGGDHGLGGRSRESRGSRRALLRRLPRGGGRSRPRNSQGRQTLCGGPGARQGALGEKRGDRWRAILTVLAASSEFLRKTNVSLWRTFPACEAPLGRPQPERLRKDRGRSRGDAGPPGHRTDKGAAEEPVTIRSW